MTFGVYPAGGLFDDDQAAGIDSGDGLNGAGIWPIMMNSYMYFMRAEAALYFENSLIGINNRNLKTFEVSLEISKNLSTLIPNDFVKVSESGISHIQAIKELKPYGYQGFLIGENFMKTDNAGQSAKQLIKDLTLWN